VPSVNWSLPSGVAERHEVHCLRAARALQPLSETLVVNDRSRRFAVFVAKSCHTGSSCSPARFSSGLSYINPPLLLSRVLPQQVARDRHSIIRPTYFLRGKHFAAVSAVSHGALQNGRSPGVKIVSA